MVKDPRKLVKVVKNSWKGSENGCDSTDGGGWFWV